MGSNFSYEVVSLPSDPDAARLVPTTIDDATIVDSVGLGIFSQSVLPAGNVVASHFCMTGYALFFNLPGVADLALTLSQIATILLGNVTVWSDLRSDLPSSPILVPVRLDSNDVTAKVTAVLSAASPEFNTRIGPKRQLEEGDLAGLGARAVIVRSDADVESYIAVVHGSVGFSTFFNSTFLAPIISVQVDSSSPAVALSSGSLAACEEGASLPTQPKTSSLAIPSRILDPARSTSPFCWPFSDSLALTVREEHLGQTQCQPTDYRPGQGPDSSLDLIRFFTGHEQLALGLTLTGLPVSNIAAQRSAVAALDFECNPDTSVCAAGTYFDGSGCSACAEGYVSTTSGLTSCRPCEAGTREKDRKTCVPCDSKSYQPSTAQSSCKACVENSRVVVASGDETIPLTPTEGATNKSACACVEGFYAPQGTDQGEECFPCPEGAVCRGDGDSERIVPVATAGFYARASDPEVFLICISNEACPGGGVEACGEGFEGDLCADCKPNFFLRAGRCVACDDGNRVAAAVGILLFIAAGAAVHRSANLDRTRAVIRSTIAAGAVINATILFLQLFNLFLLIRVRSGAGGRSGGGWRCSSPPPRAPTRRRWPEAVRSLMNSFGAVNVDLSILSLECQWDVGFDTSYRIKCVLPLLYLALYVALGAGQVAFHLATKAWGAEVLAACRRDVFAACNASLAMFSILYISTASVVFQAYACTQQPDGSLTMPTYPAMVCGSEEYHRLVLPIAQFSLVVVVVAYPLVLIITFVARYFTTWEWAAVLVSGVSTPYKGTCYWWELVESSRKFVVAVILTFGLALSPGTQIALCSVILVTAIILQVSFRPYKHRTVNALNLFLFCVLLFVLVVAGMIFNESEDAQNYGYRAGVGLGSRPSDALVTPPLTTRAGPASEPWRTSSS